MLTTTLTILKGLSMSKKKVLYVVNDKANLTEKQKKAVAQLESIGYEVELETLGEVTYGGLSAQTTIWDDCATDVNKNKAFGFPFSVGRRKIPKDVAG